MIRLAAFVAALVAALVLVWAVGNHLIRDGRVEPVAARPHFPDRNENESATRFYSTLARFDVDELRQQREAQIEFIAREVASPKRGADAPPPKLADFLSRNAPALRVLRAQLASNPPPAWKMRANDLLDTPQPDSIVIMRVLMMFAADALAEHSQRNDAAAWADLDAMWALVESLWVRPEIPSVLTALGGSRLLTAVASKLPPPQPRWWTDFVALDPRISFARALEYESWATRARAERYPIGEPDDETSFHEAMRRAAEPLVRPLRVMQADARVRDMRQLRRELAISDPCKPLPVPVPQWSSTIARLNRFIIEREGVAKLLDIENGRPFDARSACGVAHWTYRTTGEGFELSFSGHIPTPQTRIVTPLTYRR